MRYEIIELQAPDSGWVCKAFNNSGDPFPRAGIGSSPVVALANTITHVEGRDVIKVGRQTPQEKERDDIREAKIQGRMPLLPFTPAEM